MDEDDGGGIAPDWVIAAYFAVATSAVCIIGWSLSGALLLM